LIIRFLIVSFNLYYQANYETSQPNKPLYNPTANEECIFIERLQNNLFDFLMVGPFEYWCQLSGAGANATNNHKYC
jgi:hypothetical protein